MEKERLTISEERVTVEYEFLNETNKDISTEVAFPVPPYDCKFDDPGWPRSFDDFRIWIDGKEVKYQTEIKAKANGSDCSKLLRRFGVDIATFGHIDFGDFHSIDFKKLSQSQQNKLTKAGLFDPYPLWSVLKTYHWRQVFPAHKILRVRHEYAPVLGFSI